jgi:hypothetical protein
MRLKTIRPHSAHQLLLISALIAGIFAAGCATTRPTTASFREMNRLETELKRGVSTKADAQKLLGPPAGTGTAVFPTDPRPREVWSYPDIEATAARPRYDRRGIGRSVFLETLRVGASSIADVLLALGQPRGNGVVRFPVDPTPRQIWFYEQTRIDEEWRVHLKILLVFLRHERYDGHIWFSSPHPSEEKGGKR